MCFTPELDRTAAGVPRAQPGSSLGGRDPAAGAIICCLLWCVSAGRGKSESGAALWHTMRTSPSVSSLLCQLTTDSQFFEDYVVSCVRICIWFLRQFHIPPLRADPTWTGEGRDVAGLNEVLKFCEIKAVLKIILPVVSFFMFSTKKSVPMWEKEMFPLLSAFQGDKSTQSAQV